MRSSGRAMVMALFGLGFLTGAAASGAENWRGEAASRIAEFRESPFTVEVRDAEGAPVEGAEVEVEMLRHAFRFGTVVNAGYFVNSTDDEDPYRKHIRRLFNHAVLENDMKWGRWENPGLRERADETVAWLRDHGFSIRGHTMIWQTFMYGNTMPADVREALEDGGDEAKAHVRRRALEHIHTIGEAYRGVVDEWDVINEMPVENEIVSVLHPDTRPVEAPEQVDWFKAAAEAAPDAALYVNDFNILVQDSERRRGAYERQIEYLLGEGAPLHGIGFQAHHEHKSAARTPEQLWELLERFGRFGLDLAVTEFDMWGNWGETQEEAEKAQAECLERFLTILYSHPAATGFTIWGFWDRRHWRNSGAFFREDWTPKPALDVYEDLVFNQWWTREEGATDGEGRFTARAHHGTHAVTVRHGDVEAYVETAITPGPRRLTVTLPAPR